MSISSFLPVQTQAYPSYVSTSSSNAVAASSNSAAQSPGMSSLISMLDSLSPQQTSVLVGLLSEAVTEMMQGGYPQMSQGTSMPTSNTSGDIFSSPDPTLPGGTDSYTSLFDQSLSQDIAAEATASPNPTAAALSGLTTGSSTGSSMAYPSYATTALSQSSLADPLAPVLTPTTTTDPTTGLATTTSALTPIDTSSLGSSVIDSLTSPSLTGVVNNPAALTTAAGSSLGQSTVAVPSIQAIDTSLTTNMGSIDSMLATVGLSPNAI